MYTLSVKVIISVGLGHQMKILKWILIGIGAAILIGGVILLMRGDEDTWIKDNRGVYVKHGHPANTPAEVTKQQELIVKAQAKYQALKSSGQDLSNGPCLGIIADDWVADLVHSPRESVDDQTENQCAEFRNGQAHHFIELDLNNGDVVRIY